MKIVIFLIVLLAVSSKSIELSDMIQLLVKTGNSKDLGSLVSIVNKLFPEYFQAPDQKGTKLKSTLY